METTAGLRITVDMRARGDGPAAAAVSRRRLLSAVDESAVLPSQLRRLHRLREHFGSC